MKFSTREDIERPADLVFQAVSDFAKFEDLLRKRSVSIERVIDRGRAENTSWNAKARVRGRHLTIRSQVTSFDPQGSFDIASETNGIEAFTQISVTPLTRKKSRLAVSIDVRPTNFKGRLFLQPLRLAKGSLTDRFRSRVARYAAEIERHS